MKSEYSLIKATTELPYEESPFPGNPFTNSSWGTIIRYKKECVLTNYLGLAPVFRKFLELNPNFKGKKSLLTVEENRQKRRYV